MRNTLQSVLNSYRKYRESRAKSRTYRTVRYLVFALAGAYIVLLSYPQILFAHETSYKNFEVYSREPLDNEVYAVLDKVETRLAVSPINDQKLKPRIFLINSYGLYATLSLYFGSSSFGKGFAVLPSNNIFINKSDLAKDLVFRNAPANNERSLSGVIAHEATHLLIRKKFGYLRNLTMPAWKKEGFAEYVAGGSTLAYETGVKMWKANPGDGAGYQYFKYYMLVKYLLEHDKLSVEELFNREIDVGSLEAECYANWGDDMTNSTNTVTEEILALERDIMAAIKNKDAATLEPMLADNFVYRTHFGAESDKGEFLKAIASFPVEIIALRGEELKVNVYGETAVLTGLQLAEAQPPEGKAEESVVAFTDVFVRREGRWLMVLVYGVELPSEAVPFQI